MYKTNKNYVPPRVVEGRAWHPMSAIPEQRIGQHTYPPIRKKGGYRLGGCLRYGFALFIVGVGAATGFLILQATLG